MTVEGGLPSLLERGRNGEVAPIPAVREAAIELLGSTQRGPPTGTASRLTMTQTHSGPPGLMVDFGHSFRKARPLDGIDESVGITRAATRQPLLYSAAATSGSRCRPPGDKS